MDLSFLSYLVLEQTELNGSNSEPFDKFKSSISYGYITR